jgi:hypothetical protein
LQLSNHGLYLCQKFIKVQKRKKTIRRLTHHCLSSLSMKHSLYQVSTAPSISSTGLCRNGPWLDPHFSPRNTGHYLFCVDTILELNSKVEQRIQKRVRKKVWFKSQLNEFSVLCVVVMLLCLYSWVWHRNAFNIQSKLLSRFLHKGSEFIDRKLLSELIEDPKLTGLCGVCNGKLYTLHCVSYVKVSPGLKILNKTKKHKKPGKAHL